MRTLAPIRSLDYATPFDGSLDIGESLVWTGRPRQGLMLRSNDATMIPFSLMWGGFAYFWEFMVLRSYARGFTGGKSMPILFPLWGIPFVVIGTYLMFGRFFFDAWRRRQTWYGVTDRRALICQAGSTPKVTSFSAAQLGMVELQRHRDGTGSLVLAPPPAMTGRRQNFGGPDLSNRAFEHVADVDQAYRAIRALQQ